MRPPSFPGTRRGGATTGRRNTLFPEDRPSVLPASRRKFTSRANGKMDLPTRIRQRVGLAVQWFKARSWFRGNLTAMLPTLLVLIAASPVQAREGPARRFFDQGVAAVQEGDYVQAEGMFHEAAALQPASGTLHNLGNTGWRIGDRGPAILAWEQSLWLDPWNEPARTSLAYARHTANLETPDLRWFEVCSTWLPHTWWPWLTMLCFWSCVSLLVLPPVLRLRRRDWTHALASAFAAATLLCLPALAGLNSRSQLGFILPDRVPLRLTPTDLAHVTAYIESATPVRLERTRGDYVLIRTRYSTGWLRADEIGWIGRN